MIHRLNGIKWERIILDEAHVVRNYKSQSSQGVCNLRGKYRWCLTGTPIQNKELDIFALFKFLKCRPLDELSVSAKRIYVFNFFLISFGNLWSKNIFANSDEFETIFFWGDNPTKCSLGPSLKTVKSYMHCFFFHRFGKGGLTIKTQADRTD